jgi:hypothetical protein
MLFSTVSSVIVAALYSKGDPCHPLLDMAHGVSPFPKPPLYSYSQRSSPCCLLHPKNPSTSPLSLALIPLIPPSHSFPFSPFSLSTIFLPHHLFLADSIFSSPSIFPARQSTWQLNLRQLNRSAATAVPTGTVPGLGVGSVLFVREISVADFWALCL